MKFKAAKRLIVLVLVMCLALGTLPATAFGGGGAFTFSDVKTTDWFYDEVAYVYKNGLMNGTGESTFSPEQTTTRAMLVTVLYRLAGEPAVSAACPFTDVGSGEWYLDAVVWASSNGIVNGYSTTSFGSEDAVTREQMAAMLLRYAKYKGYDVTASKGLSGYADAGEISIYALEAVKWANAEGLITGRTATSLVPADTATRAEVATILMRFIESVVKGGTQSSVLLSGFAADEIYFAAGAESAVTFTVDVRGDAEAVELYNSKLGVVEDMHDDGRAGDAAANDGIYSCTINVHSYSANFYDFHAQSGSSLSNAINLYFFARPTSENVEEAQREFEAIQAHIAAVEAGYADASGYVNAASIPDILKKLRPYLEQQLNERVILRYEIDDGSAYIKFATGLTLMYEPPIEGVLAGGSDVAISFFSYQPNTDLSSDFYSGRVEAAAEYLNNCQFVRDYRHEEVTLELVKSFGSNQVVYWSGHGGYNLETKSYLFTGEKFSWSAWWLDIEYWLDCLSDRVVVGSTEKQSSLACVTSKFIDHYCGDLSNSLFMLTSCHSGRHKRLAESFLNKGAAAVLGYTNSCYSGYCGELALVTLYLLTQEYDTGNYFTLHEAVEVAKEKYGKDDFEYRDKNKDTTKFPFKRYAAEPVIFGSGDYRLANVRESDVTESPEAASATVRVNFVDKATGAELTLSELFDLDSAFFALRSTKDESFFTGGLVSQGGVQLDGNALVFCAVPTGSEYCLVVDAAVRGYQYPAPVYFNVGGDIEVSVEMARDAG